MIRAKQQLDLIRNALNCDIASKGPLLVFLVSPATDAAGVLVAWYLPLADEGPGRISHCASLVRW